MSITDFDEKLVSLKNQINEIQVKQGLGSEAISSLERDVRHLERQVAVLQVQSEGHGLQLTAIDNKISELQKRVDRAFDSLNEHIVVASEGVSDFRKEFHQHDVMETRDRKRLVIIAIITISAALVSAASNISSGLFMTVFKFFIGGG